MQDWKTSLAKSGRGLASATATPAWLRKHANSATITLKTTEVHVAGQQTTAEMNVARTPVPAPL
jgi:hypothetical protein